MVAQKYICYLLLSICFERKWPTDIVKFVFGFCFLLCILLYIKFTIVHIYLFIQILFSCYYILFFFVGDKCRRPTNLSVVWTRRSRRVASIPLAWEPDMVNPLVGHISWPVPDNHTISVTLFKDPRTHELEDKDWAFAIEDVSEFFFSNNMR